MITPLYPTDQVILELVAAMKQSFRYEVRASVCSKHCPNSRTRQLFFPISERSLVLVNGCKVKMSDRFLFRAYLNASDFHDVDCKNIDDERGMD